MMNTAAARAIPSVAAFSLILLLSAVSPSAIAIEPPPISSPPVLGIFSQPKSIHNRRNNSSSEQQYYIAASYVKWLEVGGARSIAIPYDAGTTAGGIDLLDEIFEQIDGLLLPGGDAAMSEAVCYVLERAVEANRRGRYFPVWGTCLGFEFLVTFVGNGGCRPGGGGMDVLDRDYDAWNISLPLLDVARSYKHSLYGSDADVYRTVTTRNVTMNNHESGITPAKFLSNSNLTSVWKISSTNVDRNGKPFVSTIEPLRPLSFPFYGVQYHPEKNAFEYGLYPDTSVPYEVIDHSVAGVAFSSHVARFFVDLARIGQSLNRGNSSNHYQYDQLPRRRFSMMYSYPTESGIAFEQVHIIPSASDWSTVSADGNPDPNLRVSSRESR